MNDGERKKIEWTLRISLAVMYLYSGFDLFRHPASWSQFIPYWLREMIEGTVGVNRYISFQGAVEILFALAFLLWFLPRFLARWAALASAVEFATILLLAFVPWNETNFLTTFRDIGLLGASAALYLSLRPR